MNLPAPPAPDVLRARLTAVRERIDRLLRSKPDRKCLTTLGHAFDDVTDAERLLDQPLVDTKPHILQAVDALLEVAEFRLRSVQAAIDADSM